MSPGTARIAAAYHLADMMLVMKFAMTFIANRDEVILSLTKLFRHHGRRIAGKYGRINEIEDFENSAIAYGCEALNKYDASRGAKFATFSRSYIERALRRDHFNQLGHCSETRDQFEIESAESEDPAMIDEALIEERELLSLHENTRRVVELSLAGKRTWQIAIQLGMPGKEVAFHIRQATKLIEKRRAAMSGPTLFDEVNDALGAEDAETEAGPDH